MAVGVGMVAGTAVGTAAAGAAGTVDGGMAAGRTAAIGIGGGGGPVMAGADPRGGYPGAGDETSAIQSRLANLGFYHGSIDGKVGPGTQSALKAFQASRGLQAKGQIDDETLNALGLGQGQDR
jgi:peptidoglycan hydrolase-like protein with peptidoglycan-binding domain